MIQNVLANVAGYASAVVIMVAYGLIIALVIICLIRIARYFKDAGKEQKLIRMDIGKLAEEVHLLRQEMKGVKTGQSD